MADRSGYIGRAPSDSSVTIARQTYSPTGVQTSFTFTSGYTPSLLDVYINGSRLIDISDYAATDGITIALTIPAENGDTIEAVAYKAFNVSDTTATNATSNFTVGQNLTVNGFISAGGSITGSEFYGDGSNLEGVASAGLGTALSDIAPLDVIYYTNNILSIGSTVTVDPPASTNVAYTQYAEIAVEQDHDLIVADGDDFIPDILGLSTEGVTPLPGAGGRVRADNFTNKAGNGAPNFPSGLTGTAATFSSSLTASSGSFTGNVSVGGTLTYEDVTNVDSVGLVTARTGINVLAGGINAVGVVTATTFAGSGANLTNLPSAQLTGALPAISGAALTGLPAGGVTIRSAGGSALGSGITDINFQSGATVTASGAGSTITISAGISTAETSGSNSVVTLDLSNAQDHKITATGITTITCSGGIEGESHTVRITNSGTSTVGFSTFFLFPSGSAPSLPTVDGSISLISFTVNRVGAAGTQLLAGASLNFS